MRMVMIGVGQVGGIIGCVIREGEPLGVPTPLCRATLVFGDRESPARDQYAQLS